MFVCKKNLIHTNILTCGFWGGRFVTPTCNLEPVTQPVTTCNRTFKHVSTTFKHV